MSRPEGPILSVFEKTGKKPCQFCAKGYCQFIQKCSGRYTVFLDLVDDDDDRNCTLSPLTFRQIVEVMAMQGVPIQLDDLISELMASEESIAMDKEANMIEDFWQTAETGKGKISLDQKLAIAKAHKPMGFDQKKIVPPNSVTQESTGLRESSERKEAIPMGVSLEALYPTNIIPHVKSLGASNSIQPSGILTEAERRANTFKNKYPLFDYVRDGEDVFETYRWNNEEFYELLSFLEFEPSRFFELVPELKAIRNLYSLDKITKKSKPSLWRELDKVYRRLEIPDQYFDQLVPHFNFLLEAIVQLGFEV